MRSPCLKLKPVSKLTKAKPWLSVNVEPYGGGLWHTWFDRDLSLAGRVLVRTPSGGLQHRLVRQSLSPVSPICLCHCPRWLDLLCDSLQGSRAALMTNMVPYAAGLAQQ